MEKTLWGNDHIAAFGEWAEMHGYSKKTINTYLSMFMCFCSFIEKSNISLKDASQSLISEFFKSRAISEKTKSTYLWLLSDIFNRMIELGEIEHNPAERLMLEKKKNARGRTSKRLPVVLSEAETREFLDYIHSLPDQMTWIRVKASLLVLLGCGLRAQEICDLKDRDMHLDDESPYLTVIGKNNKERIVPIPESIIADLEAWRDIRSDKTENFFNACSGRPYSPSGIYRMVRRALSDSGVIKVKMSPHILRHTFITAQLREGVPLSTVKVWAGHEKITTTAIYEHLVVASRGYKTSI